MAETQPIQTTDIDSLLDFGPWGTMQKAIVALAALAIIFDGMDIQMMGFAIPAIAKDWSVARAAFSSILALGLIGVTLGTVFGGFLGDRIGRRNALIANVILFGAATFAIAFCHSLHTLLTLRIIAGLGISGALPNAATLTAEFTPRRNRPVAVTLAIVCIPLGGFLAGLISANVLAHGNWRILFWIGGLSPILLGLLLLRLLPESPRYLARHPERAEDLRTLLRRMGKDVPPGVTVVEHVPPQGPTSGLAAELLGPGQVINTLALWIAFFCCLVSVYLVFNWLPSMLSGRGLSLTVASQALAVYNFGGIFGAIFFAWWISKQGSRIPLLTGAIAGLLSALVLRGLPINPAGSHTPLLVALCVHGLFVNAIQTTMYALAAHIYTTKVRATGVASAVAVGRTGAILSAFMGATILGLGTANYFLLLAIGMTGVFIALFILRNHIQVANPAAQPEALTA